MAPHLIKKQVTQLCISGELKREVKFLASGRVVDVVERGEVGMAKRLACRQPLGGIEDQQPLQEAVTDTHQTNNCQPTTEKRNGRSAFVLQE